jgi:hypothetical protein
MFRTRWPRICPQGPRLKPFDVPSANGSLGAPGHLRRQTNVRLKSDSCRPRRRDGLMV